MSDKHATDYMMHWLVNDAPSWVREEVRRIIAERDDYREKSERLLSDVQDMEARAMRAEAEATAAREPEGGRVMRIDWQGDLSDDCTARLGDITAHVEALGIIQQASIDDDGKASRKHGERWQTAYWFIGVYRGDKTLYHSAEHGGLITDDDGSCARGIAEAVMRAAIGTSEARDGLEGRGAGTQAAGSEAGERVCDVL